MRTIRFAVLALVASALIAMPIGCGGCGGFYIGFLDPTPTAKVASNAPAATKPATVTPAPVK